MKKLTCMLLVLLLALPGMALAKTNAEYGSTQSFLNWMDANDISYILEGINNSDCEVVNVPNSSDGFTYEIHYFFDASEENASLRVWNLISYSDSDYAKVLRVCNDLNVSYKYITFYCDTSDNTVTARMDTIFRSSDVGEIVGEATLRMVNILGDVYETLSVYDK